MTEIDQALDGLVPPFAAGLPDWSDVLARAKPRRRPLRIALAVAASAVATAVPALALSERVREAVGVSSPPGPRLTASLGSAALQLTAPGTVLAHWKIILPRRMVHTGHGARAFTSIRFHWRLAGTGGRLEIRSGERTLATLCAPCANGREGDVEIRRNAAIAIFNDHATAVLTTDGRPVRGRIVLRRLR